MNTRLSPNHDQLQQLNGVWREINRMPSLFTSTDDAANAARLGIADLSFLTRFGVKVSEQLFFKPERPVPDRPNSWCLLPEGHRCPSRHE